MVSENLPEKTLPASVWTGVLRQAGPYFLAVIAAFVTVGIFIALMGWHVMQAYQTILFTSFRTENGFVQTLLDFCRLCCFRSLSPSQWLPANLTLAAMAR